MKVTPTRKVSAGVLAGAVTVIGIWVAQAMTGIQIPAEVSSAITTLFSFIVSWLIPDQYEE